MRGRAVPVSRRRSSDPRPGNGSGLTLRSLHRILGLLCLAFVALIVVGNTVISRPPGGLDYFRRGDVAALLGLGAVLAAVLFWSAAGDDDLRRVTGSVASAAMTGLFLGTLSIPVLVVPLSLAGCLRAPVSRRARLALVALVPLGVAAGVALPYVGRALQAG